MDLRFKILVNENGESLTVKLKKDEFIKAIEKAGGDDREAVTKALAEMKDFPAVTGMLTINATHDAEMPIGVIEIKDGTRVYLGEVQPEM